MAVKATTPKKRSRRFVAAVVILVLLAACGGVGLVAKKYMETPAVGHVVYSLPPVTKQAEVELKQFDGPQYSFVHPVTYVEQVQNAKPNPAVLESRTFVSSAMVSRVLVATVSKLPSGNLTDDSSYVMRTQNPEKYKMQQIVVKNEKVTIFTSQNDQELQQTAFWPHAGKVLSFTLTGVASETDKAKAEYQAMVESISWR